MFFYLGKLILIFFTLFALHGKIPASYNRLFYLGGTRTYKLRSCLLNNATAQALVAIIKNRVLPKRQRALRCVELNRQ